MYIWSILALVSQGQNSKAVGRIYEAVTWLNAFILLWLRCIFLRRPAPFSDPLWFIDLTVIFFQAALSDIQCLISSQWLTRSHRSLRLAFVGLFMWEERHSPGEKWRVLLGQKGSALHGQASWNVWLICWFSSVPPFLCRPWECSKCCLPSHPSVATWHH